MFGFWGFSKKQKQGRQRCHGGRCRVPSYKSILQVPPGETAVIRQHHANGAIRQRLLDLGFIPGRDVEVLRVATFGCPIELKVCNYCVTLRRTEAIQIEVE